MLYYIIIFNCLAYSMSKNMSNYKLLSNTPISKYCPRDFTNIYKIHEKHPDLPEITKCCAIRISNNFILTEKVCLKKFNPIFVTARSCNEKVIHHAQALFTPKFENSIHGVLLILINGVFNTKSNEIPIFYNIFFSEKNELDWEKKQCVIYGISIQSTQKELKWTTLSNNTVTVHRHCRQGYLQKRFGADKWLCPDKSHVQFCDEDIGCPMMYDNKIIGIASQRYNWKTWSTNMDCGNLDVETRYLFLNKKYVKWINDTISK